MDVRTFGGTPLCLAAAACMDSSPSVMEALLAAGADVNATSQSGMTPLMLVARSVGPCCHACAALLLTNPSLDLLAVNASGATAEEVARAEDQGDIGDMIATEVGRPVTLLLSQQPCTRALFSLRLLLLLFVKLVNCEPVVE